MEADVMETTDPGIVNGEERGEALGRKLAGYGGPSYRRAYLSRMLQSGVDFLRSGNARSAEYCLGKVESELEAARSAVENAEADGARHAAVSADGIAGVAGKAVQRPLDRLRANWREERLRKAQAVLDRHGPRLSSLERRMYRESLAKWSKSAAAPSQAGSGPADSRADNALIELRRRLYGRILKTQKADLSRRSGGRSLALISAHKDFAGPVGPYNDRHNLEGVINLLAQADPAWVEEFLDLYRKLAGLKGLLPALPAALRK